MSTLKRSRYGTPVASYRLQLHPGFGFDRASDMVPYLHRLGVSHVYLSPFFTASPGSSHGYDVFDHSQVNRELGGLAGLYELSEALAAHGMGLIADMVPNHVGVAGGVNPWWRDVLRHGQTSPYAAYFDIDWEGQPQMPRGILGFPILGQPFGQTLEAGELRLDVAEHDIFLFYWENSFPLAPHSYRDIIGIPPPELRDELGDPALLAELIDLLDELPSADYEHAEHLLARFRSMMASEPAMEAHVRERVAALNGTPGDPSSFDRLEGILLDQHYRLTDWRISGEELNYRRFFDITGLAAIRVEREEVFDATHGLLLDLVRNGIVTGVRIDHIDGLYDPSAYLHRLRERLDEASAGHDGVHVPIYVEKILDPHEKLPRWPVDGTSGYDFLAHVNGLFVDHDAQRHLTTTYERFLGEYVRFPRIAYEAKLHIADRSFAGEANVLALQIYRIAQRHRLHRDHTLRALQRAITTVLACFPVYRTYLGEDSDADVSHRVINRAIAEAGARDSTLSPSALDFLREVLLLERDDLDPEEQERRAHFRRRFQQVSSPVMAKGMEDTAFYRYNRLVSLNEVGGDPATFGILPGQLHEWFEERATVWPQAMSNSSTHDTKRSEDVRARLNVLSEIPGTWRREVATWSRLNARHRSTVSGEVYPDPNTEYYLYQALLGAWPIEGPGPDFVERIQEHMTKAMREAKVISSWVDPRQEAEDAVLEFVRRILDRRRSRGFTRRLQAMVEHIAPAATYNSLAALLLKCFAPGFPDIYQGMEFPRLDLTDPDNRRPVDFEGRIDALHRLERESMPPDDLHSETARLWFTHRGLDVRSRCHRLLTDGDYRPVEVQGKHTRSVFAFTRNLEDDVLLVAVPRLVHGLLGGSDTISAAAWGDTALELPGDVDSWENLLLPVPVESPACEVLFDPVPFAVLHGKRGR